MNLPIKQIIHELVNDDRAINHCFFSNHDSLAPQLAYQVNFPRLEIIVNGEQEILWPSKNNEQQHHHLSSNDILFVAANSWNKPVWSKPVTTLSILFGKQQLGFSLLHWNGTQFKLIEQLNTPRRGPRVGTLILQTLTELSINYTHQRSASTAHLLIRSLLSNCLELLSTQFETTSKATSLFESVRQYIDSQFQQDINRESLANLFHISPNYLSALFQKEGKTGLNEYIIATRLEHAKSLLKRHDLNIKEIAISAGFNDSNYFCRIFKKNTARSPSEYRKQYNSKISEKDG